jgi:capsular polysaccharide transport system permease protein
MSFARGLVSQFEVVHALALRETRTRFGAHQLGYLWALVEPVLMVVTFIVVFMVVDREAPEGMDLFSFMTTGILPYVVFSNSLNQVANAISGNKALLFYPHVQPLDLVIARSLLELMTGAAVLIALMGSHALWSRDLHVVNPLYIVGGWFFAGMLGTVFGLVFCSLAEYSPAIERARSPLMRPMFWISGVFFTVDHVPVELRETALINPLLHCTEMFRAGFFASHDTTHVDVGYVLLWIVVVGFAGLALERNIRRRIQLT